MINIIINDLELVTRLMSDEMIKAEINGKPIYDDIISVDDATDEQMTIDLQKKVRILYSDLFTNILLCLRSVQNNSKAVQSLFVDNDKETPIWKKLYHSVQG